MSAILRGHPPSVAPAGSPAGAARTAGRWLAGLLGLSLLPLAAHAGPDPYRIVIRTEPSPYWGYYYNPYYGYLHGIARVMEASGQLQKDVQKAAMMREKVRQEKIVTHRKKLENWAWEREFKTQVYEKERKEMLERTLERSRTDPPVTEILAAQSLNTLLKDLKAKELSLNDSIQIDPAMLPYIHVADAGVGGNIGLLKADKLFWPLALTRPEFARQRDEIERLVATMKQKAAANDRPTEELFAMRDQLDHLQERINTIVKSRQHDSVWTARNHITAMTFINQMKEALYALDQPDATFLLSPLQGKSVAELVEHMKKHGLSFAPATVGCERHYVALHRALADEVTRYKIGGSGM